MQVAENLGETIGSGGGSDIALGSGEVAGLQGEHTEIGLGLGQVGCQALGLLDILLGCLVVATGILDGGQVVIGAGIAGIDLGGELIDILLLVERGLEGGTIEELLDGELGGVAVDLGEDLLVGAAYRLVVDGETGAAQLGQDAVGELAEGGADVLDLLLTLLGVLIHGEHAQDDVLVLDVAGLDELLEAVPVLGGVLGIDIGLHLDALQLLVDILLGVLLTLGSQTVVDGEATIGRGIGRHLDILEVEALAVGIDLLEHLHKLLHGIVGQLALAEVGLLDEELDIGLLLLLVDALVGIGRDGGLSGDQRLLIQLGGGDDAFGDLYLGHLHLLVADAGQEGEVHIGLVVVGILEVGLHRVVATQTVGDGLVVAQYLLALECGAVALDDGAVGIAQFGHDGHDGLTLHVFLGEMAIDGGWHGACLRLQRIGGHVEVIGRQWS